MRLHSEAAVRPSRSYSSWSEEEWEDGTWSEGEAFEEEGRGKRGRIYIRWVQRSLNGILGLRLAVDGLMGPRTERAVSVFQRQEGLKVDGIVGPRTERALITSGASSPPRTVSPAPAPPTAPLQAPPDSGRLEFLRPFAGPSTVPTVANSLNLVRIISAYHGIPWKIGYTILQHEGGVRLFKHRDGVMQTTSGVRRAMIPRIPRALKLALLELPPGDQTSDHVLANRLLAEFPHRIAVQIATGVQELKENLRKFNGYVALAYQAYNAGAGWACYTVLRGRGKTRPHGVDELQWENMCRFGASLLHQPVQNLRAKTGIWQCDANIPACSVTFRFTTTRPASSSLHSNICEVSLNVSFNISRRPPAHGLYTKGESRVPAGKCVPGHAPAASTSFITHTCWGEITMKWQGPNWFPCGTMGSP